MKNRFLLMACALFLCAAPVHLRAEAVVSVLYFENLRGDMETQWISKGIADSLISELSQVEGLAIVEREELQNVIEEQQLALSGLTSDEGTAELGRILNARFLVSGSYAVMGQNIQISCRITDTSSARIEGSTTDTVTMGALPSLHTRLAGFVCDTLDYPYRSFEPETPSLTAMEHYYRGIDLFDQKKYDEAVGFLEKALAEEPTYTGPRKTLESCYTFLKDFKRARQTREIQQLAELLHGLQRRLAQRPFLTYGEMVQKAASRGATAEQLQRIAQEHPALLRGNTPAEVAWNIQIVMGEIAMRSVSYFEDHTTADRMYGQIIGIARKVRPQFRDDPFLPEILYQEMLARSFRGDWPGVKTVCEEIMTGWPDFRMNYAVEEYYERALDNMGS